MLIIEGGGQLRDLRGAVLWAQSFGEPVCTPMQDDSYHNWHDNTWKRGRFI